MKRLILEITNDGHYFRSARYVILELDAELIEEIRQRAEDAETGATPEAALSLSCRGANLDYYAPLDNGKIALKEIPGWMDSVHLSVHRDHFCLTGFYGYSDVSWSTGAVPLSALQEEGVYDMR